MRQFDKDEIIARRKATLYGAIAGLLLSLIGLPDTAIKPDKPTTGMLGIDVSHWPALLTHRHWYTSLVMCVIVCVTIARLGVWVAERIADSRVLDEDEEQRNPFDIKFGLMMLGLIYVFATLIGFAIAAAGSSITGTIASGLALGFAFFAVLAGFGVLIAVIVAITLAYDKWGSSSVKQLGAKLKTVPPISTINRWLKAEDYKRPDNTTDTEAL